MYVYELARDLGAEPRELIERAAAEEMGHLAPNSELTVEQAAQLRTSYIRANSTSRGSLFAHGAAAAAEASSPRTDPSPPSTPSSPPSAPEPSPGAFDPPPSPAGPPQPVESGSAAPIDGPLSGAGLGQPLGFTPPGQDPPPPMASPPAPPTSPPPSRPRASPPSEPRWEDTRPLWEPLPGTVSMGGSAPPRVDEPREHEDYSQPREYRYDPSQAQKPPPEPPRPTSTISRSVVIGIVGLIVIVLASMYVGRRLDIIGPGAERHCVLLTTPVVDGEGQVEELVCLDGYGEEVRREVLSQGADVTGIQFGTTADGAITRVVQIDDFCRGASDFRSFREGLLSEVAEASSMASVGSWYDVNDGFGEAGVGRMLGSFGNAGPNPAVQQLESYLLDVHEAARAPSVPQAQMLLGAAEGTYIDPIVAVRNFANNNC